MKDKEKKEQLILKEVPIIITTCHCFMNSRLSELKFKKVIVDEAAQASEIEILIAAKHAEQLVLVGDHKQLGPIFKVEVSGCDSMFSRFMEAGYPISTMLNECYRLHPEILTIPNNLFYEGKIKSSYTHSFETEFISRDKPMLFIHSEAPEERYGVSFTNEGECEQVVELLRFI
jgi:regulator of nonsense transcripts 1